MFVDVLWMAFTLHIKQNILLYFKEKRKIYKKYDLILIGFRVFI